MGNNGQQLATMGNNEQQWTTIRGATGICDAGFLLNFSDFKWKLFAGTQWSILETNKNQGNGEGEGWGVGMIGREEGPGGEGGKEALIGVRQ